jgi:hypothetical protein
MFAESAECGTIDQTIANIPTAAKVRFVGALVAPREYGGVALTAPPANETAAVSWRTAYATCDSMCSGVPPTTISLALATSPAAGHINPDGSISPLMKHTLVYVIVATGVPCRPVGPISIQRAKSSRSDLTMCTNVSFVDAQTAQVLYGVSGPNL